MGFADGCGLPRSIDGGARRGERAPGLSRRRPLFLEATSSGLPAIRMEAPHAGSSTWGALGAEPRPPFAPARVLDVGRRRLRYYMLSPDRNGSKGFGC